MSVMKPMKTLHFPAFRPRPYRVARQLVSVEMLLSECREQQRPLAQDSQRLLASLRRLSVLANDMTRESHRLTWTLRRLVDTRTVVVRPAGRSRSCIRCGVSSDWASP